MMRKHLLAASSALCLSLGIAHTAQAQDYSKVSYIASGAASYAVPFPLLDPGDLLVEDNGVATGAYTYASGILTFTTAPTLGDTLTLERVTPVESATVQFQAGIISSIDLNLNQTQNIYALQELEDDATHAVHGTVADGDLSLPLPANRANSLYGFGPAGAPTTYPISTISAGGVVPLVSIARAEVPTWNLGSVSTVALDGYYQGGDLGMGAVYSTLASGRNDGLACTSSGLQAVLDKGGHYLCLQIAGHDEAGWHGAKGDATWGTFYGTIASGILTIPGSQYSNGQILVGQTLVGPGVPAGVTIKSGSGLVWTTSSSSLNLGPEIMSTWSGSDNTAAIQEALSSNVETVIRGACLGPGSTNGITQAFGVTSPLIPTANDQRIKTVCASVNALPAWNGGSHGAILDLEGAHARVENFEFDGGEELFPNGAGGAGGIYVGRGSDSIENVDGWHYHGPGIRLIQAGDVTLRRIALTEWNAVSDPQAMFDSNYQSDGLLCQSVTAATTAADDRMVDFTIRWSGINIHFGANCITQHVAHGHAYGGRPNSSELFTLTNYNSTTGAVTATLTALSGATITALMPGVIFTLSGITGTGTDVATLNGRWAATAGTVLGTLNFTIPTGLNILTVNPGTSVNGVCTGSCLSVPHVDPIDVQNDSSASGDYIEDLYLDDGLIKLYGPWITLEDITPLQTPQVSVFTLGSFGDMFAIGNAQAPSQLTYNFLFGSNPISYSNMEYLPNDGALPITATSAGDGVHVTYTIAGGWTVNQPQPTTTFGRFTVTGETPSGFNCSQCFVQSATATSVTLANSFTGTATGQGFLAGDWSGNYSTINAIGANGTLSSQVSTQWDVFSTAGNPDYHHHMRANNAAFNDVYEASGVAAIFHEAKSSTGLAIGNVAGNPTNYEAGDETGHCLWQDNGVKVAIFQCNSQNMMELNAGAPSVLSGFASTGSAFDTGSNAYSFRLTIGTTPGNVGQLTMPFAAPHKWVCLVKTLAPTSAQMLTETDQVTTADTTTVAAFGSFTTSTGVATAWTAGQVLQGECAPH